MLRSIFRTSLWVARKNIKGISSVILSKCNHMNKLESSCDYIYIRNFADTKTPQPNVAEFIDPVIYEEICSETLESLCDYFEEIIETSADLKGADVTYSDGVLTIDLGPTHGTYVINRQTPNKQIWLSSPLSGPKRYDLVLKDGGYWLYKHDGVTLHQLLQKEISEIIDKVDFKKCSHSLV